IEISAFIDDGKSFYNCVYAFSGDHTSKLENSSIFRRKSCSHPGKAFIDRIELILVKSTRDNADFILIGPVVNDEVLFVLWTFCIDGVCFSDDTLFYSKTII